MCGYAHNDIYWWLHRSLVYSSIRLFLQYWILHHEYIVFSFFHFCCIIIPVHKQKYKSILSIVPRTEYRPTHTYYYHYISLSLPLSKIIIRLLVYFITNFRINSFTISVRKCIIISTNSQNCNFMTVVMYINKKS